MAIKFEKIQPGMTLYDRHRERMGRTTLRTIGEWPVKVVSVDKERRTARVKWNYNPETTYSERDLKKLYDWSMDDECAEVTRTPGLFSAVVAVRKKKAGS